MGVRRPRASGVLTELGSRLVDQGEPGSLEHVAKPAKLPNGWQDLCPTALGKAFREGISDQIRARRTTEPQKLHPDCCGRVFWENISCRKLHQILDFTAERRTLVRGKAHQMIVFGQRSLTGAAYLWGCTVKPCETDGWTQ